MNPLHYPLGARAPAPGETIEIADGVHWVRVPLAGPLRHINVWLLRDDDGWCVVDCGLGGTETQALWERVFAVRVGRGRVRRVIATHMHSDHLGLAQWLCARWNAPLHIASREAALARRLLDVTEADREATVAFYRGHGVTDTALLASVRRAPTHYPARVPGLPADIRTLEDGQRVRIDGRDWRAIESRGHSPEHLSFHCAATGVLIAGDMLLPRISAHVAVSPYAPDGDPLADFLASMRVFLALPGDTLVLPAHGEPFIGIAARVHAIEAHHAARCERIAALCAAPRTAAEITAALFADRPLDRSNLLLALHETIAHLHRLQAQGTLAAAADNAGVLRFATASVAVATHTPARVVARPAAAGTAAPSQ